MNWIDSHVHVWTKNEELYPRRSSYPIPAGFDIKDFPVAPAHFPPETIMSHATPFGVDRIVLVQMSFYGTDNSYMTDAIKRYPESFRGIGYVDPDDIDVGYGMATLLEKGVTGFRLVCESNAPNWLQSDGYDSMFRAAAETRQAIGVLINPEGLNELGRMAAKHPDTIIVIDHMSRIGANGQIHREDVKRACELAIYKNIYVKISAFYALGRKEPPHTELIPMIRHFYDAFGANRLMWASDCPFQVVDETYEDSISLVRDDLEFLSVEEKDQILRGTAESVYFFQ